MLSKAEFLVHSHLKTKCSLLVNLLPPSAALAISGEGDEEGVFWNITSKHYPRTSAALSGSGHSSRGAGADRHAVSRGGSITAAGSGPRRSFQPLGLSHLVLPLLSVSGTQQSVFFPLTAELMGTPPLLTDVAPLGHGLLVAFTTIDARVCSPSPTERTSGADGTRRRRKRNSACTFVGNHTDRHLSLCHIMGGHWKISLSRSKSP
jgi:hypothetical protein